MPDIFGGSYSLGGIALDSISPSAVEDDGGYELVIYGTFKDMAAQVFLVDGPTEYPCYGGASGQGYDPHPLGPSALACAAPVAPPGDYVVRVVQGLDEATSDTAPTPFVLTLVAHNWRERVFSLRRVFPPWYRTGPRTLDTVELGT